VAVEPGTVTLTQATSLQLTTTLTDVNGARLDRPVTWSSSAPAVASVDASGLVQAVSVGSATVTANSEGRSGTAVVTVRVPVGSVVIASPGSEPLEIGVTLQLTATVRDAAGAPLTDRELLWTSANDL